MFLDLDYQISKIKNLVVNSLLQSDQMILNYIQPKHNCNLLKSINNHISINNGKQLRPLLLLLSANAIDTLTNDEVNHQNHIKLATAIELIHIASLLHDDVLDNSQIRRNKKTINAAFNNKCAILSGDFLYSKAFKIISGLNNKNNNQIISSISCSTNLMIEGEILQLSEKYNFNITQKKYLQIINNKTGQLFLVTMQLPGILNAKILKSNNLNSTFLAECGLNFGIAYQLLDDIFDYYKHGNDTTEGRITLPIIFVLNNANLDTNTKQHIINIILEQNNLNDYQQLNKLNLLKNIILNNGGFDYTLDLAKKYLIKAKIAINVLKESEYKKAILQIINCLLNCKLPKTSTIQSTDSYYKKR